MGGGGRRAMRFILTAALMVGAPGATELLAAGDATTWP
jgi:hypothetical protein